MFDDIENKLNNLHLPEICNWLTNKETQESFREILPQKLLASWLTVDIREDTLQGQHTFCDQQVLEAFLEASKILQTFSNEELLSIRKRSNPFEATEKVIFVNRAATKFANLDAILHFTNPVTRDNESLLLENELLLFVDICGGPGGFVDYMLWRKSWLAKGFGITSRTGDGTKYNFNRFATGYDSFDTYYGIARNGNIADNHNRTSFITYVHKYCPNGVHLAVADAGVEISMPSASKELLSKELIICNCIIALGVLQMNGTFIMKVSNTFTRFTVGLIYLLYKCFHAIAIVKPNGSRPISSERYLICKWMRKNVKGIQKHLNEIYNSMCIMRDQSTDIVELVPLDILMEDKEFYEYIQKSNNEISHYQTKHLLNLPMYKDNSELVDHRQNELRLKCLRLWNLPENQETLSDTPCEELINNLLGPWQTNQNFIQLPAVELLNKQHLMKTIKNYHNWYIVPISVIESDTNRTYFFSSKGGAHVFMYRNDKWILTPSDLMLVLPPKTFVYGEIVTEYTTSEKGLMKETQAFHIIDGMCLGGVDIRQKSLQERIKCCQQFSFSINSLGTVYKDRSGKFLKKMEIRCKTMYKLERQLHKTILYWRNKCTRHGQHENSVIANVERIENPRKFYKINGCLFLNDNEVSDNSYAVEQNFKTTAATKLVWNWHFVPQKILNIDCKNDAQNPEMLYYSDVRTAFKF